MAYKIANEERSALDVTSTIQWVEEPGETKQKRRKVGLPGLPSHQEAKNLISLPQAGTKEPTYCRLRKLSVEMVFSFETALFLRTVSQQ